MVLQSRGRHLDSLIFCWRNTDHPYLFCGEKDTHCHQGTTISVKRLRFGGPRFTTDLLFYITRGSTVSNPGQLLGIWVVFTFLGFIFFLHLVWILSVTCTRNTLVATDRTEVYAPYQIVFTFTCKHSILPLEFGFWALTSFLHNRRVCCPGTAGPHGLTGQPVEHG